MITFVFILFKIFEVGVASQISWWWLLLTVLLDNIEVK